MIATKFNLQHRIQHPAQPPTWRAYDLILYETLKNKGLNPLTAQQIAKLAAQGSK